MFDKLSHNCKKTTVTLPYFNQVHLLMGQGINYEI